MCFLTFPAFPQLAPAEQADSCQCCKKRPRRGRARCATRPWLLGEGYCRGPEEGPAPAPSPRLPAVAGMLRDRQ